MVFTKGVDILGSLYRVGSKNDIEAYIVFSIIIHVSLGYGYGDDVSSKTGEKQAYVVVSAALHVTLDAVVVKFRSSKPACRSSTVHESHDE